MSLLLKGRELVCSRYNTLNILKRSVDRMNGVNFTESEYRVYVIDSVSV